MARSESLALIAPACLLLGGLGGALITSQVLDGSSSAEAASNGPALRVDGAGSAATPDLAPATSSAASAVTAAAAAAAVPTDSGSARRSVADAIPGDLEEDAPSAEELGQANSLIAELTALLRSGRIEQTLADEEAMVIDRLIDTYLELGDTGAAYALLGRVETRAGNWYFVSQALRNAGQIGLADEALAQAIRLGFSGDGNGGGIPMDIWQMFQRYQVDTDEWIDQLRATSPDIVADILMGEASSGELSSTMRIDLIQSLREAGRTEQALAEVEALLAEGESNISALRELRELDPERAEELLDQLMAGNPSTELELEYFRLLNDGGRAEEALAMIAGRSADGTLPTHLLREAMRTMSAEVVREHVDAWAAGSQGNVGVQTEIAQYYTRAGDFESAANAYLDIYDVAANGVGDRVPLIPDSVAQAAPGAFVQRLDRMTAHAGTDDEYWGDIADSYWRVGQFQAAEDCWRRANEIDPGDGEWTGKITAVENGNDPL